MGRWSRFFSDSPLPCSITRCYGWNLKKKIAAWMYGWWTNMMEIYLSIYIYIYKLEIEWTWWCQNGILTVNIFRWSLVNPLLYPESWWLSIVFSVANGRKLQTHQNLIVVNISHNVFPFKLYIYPYFYHTNCWSVTSPSVIYFYLCHYIIYI